MINLITIMNVYLIIGILITVNTYEDLCIKLTTEIEEKSYIFSQLSVNEVRDIIKYLPLLTVIIWPVYVINYIIGMIESIIKLINKK